MSISAAAAQSRAPDDLRPPPPDLHVGAVARYGSRAVADAPLYVRIDALIPPEHPNDWWRAQCSRAAVGMDELRATPDGWVVYGDSDGRPIRVSLDHLLPVHDLPLTGSAPEGTEAAEQEGYAAIDLGHPGGNEDRCRYIPGHANWHYWHAWTRGWLRRRAELEAASPNHEPAAPSETAPTSDQEDIAPMELPQDPTARRRRGARGLRHSDNPSRAIGAVGVETLESGFNAVRPVDPGKQIPLAHIPDCPYRPRQEYDIPIGDLAPDPHQPRKLFDAAKLQALADSLRAGGQIRPIVFRLHPAPGPDAPPLYLVDGERRWRAAQLAGIPTLIGVLDTSGADGAELIARQALLNAPGAELQPWDWVLTFHHLARTHELSPSGIAATLGKRGIAHGNPPRPWTRSQIANYLRLLELPAWAQDLISEGSPPVLTPSHGLLILPHIGRVEIMGALRKRFVSDEERAGTEAEALDTNEEEIEPEPPRITIARLKDMIRQAYSDLYLRVDVSSWGSNGLVVPRFDWQKECQECAHLGLIDGYGKEKQPYCMNRECFDVKNKAEGADDAARAAKQQAASAKRQASASRKERIGRAARGALIDAAERTDSQDLLDLVLWAAAQRVWASDYVLRPGLADSAASAERMGLGEFLQRMRDRSGAALVRRIWVGTLASYQFDDKTLSEIAGILGVDLEAAKAAAAEAPDDPEDKDA